MNTSKKPIRNAIMRLSLFAAIGATPMLAISQGASQGATPGQAPNVSPNSDSDTMPPEIVPGASPRSTKPGTNPTANSYNSQPDVPTTADTAGAKPKAKHSTTKHRKAQVKRSPADTSSTGDSSATGNM
ncbi:MAG: hypothetical protein JWL63_901 [Rhodocyclales bacterium]|nr:hypothetical protein [Rhodocyclales bacterium]